MARVRIKSFVPQFNRELNREFVKRLNKVGEIVASQVRKDLSVSTRANGPSEPGEAPHADTGFLRKSITYEVMPATLTVRVGTPVIYGLYLTEGTGRMDARPFLRPAVEKLRKRIIRELTKPTPGGGDAPFTGVGAIGVS